MIQKNEPNGVQNAEIKSCFFKLENVSFEGCGKIHFSTLSFSISVIKLSSARKYVTVHFGT